MVVHRKNFGGVQTFADYSYDNIGNIKHAEYKYDSVPYTFVDYNYDRYNQLTKEVHSPLSMGIDLRSAEYAYDEFGNITDVTRTDSSGKVTKNRYVYSDKTGWQDLLTSYNGHTITYDEIGNPLSYYNGKNYSFVWEFGRQLCRSTSGGTDITYDYNKYGIRTDKTVKGKYTDRYILDGDRVIGMERTKSGSSVKDVYHFMYDEMGNIWLALCYIGGSTTPVRYYYRTNAQGDVKQIVDKDNNIIAYYAYDAWGRTLAILDGNDDPITNASHFAIVNPFRYRGYVYDNETGFYYLQSRYYDPEIGRFNNADGYTSTAQGNSEHNMFSYCGNDPVNRKDTTGQFWNKITNFFSKTWSAIKSLAKKTFGSRRTKKVTQKIPYYSSPSIFPFTIETGRKEQCVSNSGEYQKPIVAYAESDVEADNAEYDCGIEFNINDTTIGVSIGTDNIGVGISAINGDNVASAAFKLNLSELKLGLEFSSSSPSAWDSGISTDYTFVGVNGMSIMTAYLFLQTGQLFQTPAYAY